MIYILNFFAVFVYYFFVKVLCKNKGIKDKCFGIIVSVHAILFRILSNPFDFADTMRYADAYTEISDFSFQEVAFSFHEYTVWGQGYAIINWLISRLSLDYNYYFVIIGLFITGGTMWFYRKTSYSLLLTATLFFLYPMLYLMSFAVLRQHIAAVVVLIALYNINNYKISIPLSLFAPLIHTSAIVFIPFFLWRKIKLSNSNPTKIIIYMLIGIILLRILVGVVLGYLSTLLMSERNASFADEGDNLNIIPVIILGILVVTILWEKIFTKCRNIDLEIIKFLLYGFLISIFGIGLSGAGRLTIFFLYVVPIASTYLIHYAQRYRLMNQLCIFFILIIFLRQMYYMHSSWVLDFSYNFIWNK